LPIVVERTLRLDKAQARLFYNVFRIRGMLRTKQKVGRREVKKKWLLLGAISLSFNN
jgi:hypothetical protein